MREIWPIAYSDSYLQIPHAQKPIHSGLGSFPPTPRSNNLAISFISKRQATPVPSQALLHLLTPRDLQPGESRVKKRSSFFCLRSFKCNCIDWLRDQNCSQTEVCQSWSGIKQNTSYLKNPYEIPLLTSYISSAVGVGTGMLLSSMIKNDWTWNAPIA